MRDFDFDLRKLNSATKYPSIPTHHELGPGGILQESGNPFKDHDGPVFITEKVDGVNGRLICYNDDWYIGSREELLTAYGDRVPNQVHRIVETLEPLAQPLDTDYEIVVFYFEVYGDRKMPGWNTYGDGKVTCARLFDVAHIPTSVLDWDVERIASWRDQGGQQFDPIPLPWWGGHTEVPPLGTIDHGSKVPETIEGMRHLLDVIAPYTQASINPGSKNERPEGIVLRTADRSIITKARYSSYDRTLKERT